MTPAASPAVERAADAARRLAADRPVALGDWVRALTADDEGKPALLVMRLGVDLSALAAHLEADPGPAAPPDYALFASGRDKALDLTSDATLTTDALFLAVLAADPTFTPLGLTADRVEANLSPNPISASGDDPGPDLVIRPNDDHVDAARAVDANLNRAREALRVLDDFARFVRNDRVLSGELKHLRHALAAAEALLPGGLLLAGRDTPGDVGTTLSVPGEYVRTGAAHVAAVNVKRLQESLRSLEEFGKILSLPFAREMESARYQAYALDKLFPAPSGLRGRLANARLTALLSGRECVAALDWTIGEIAAGGVDVVQLREKTLTDRELVTRARAVRRWSAAAGVLFIVNDRPDVARLADADGVHLGQDDVRVADARRILGPDALVGVSTHDLDQVRRAVLDGADYLGIGPTFPSHTKEFAHFPGLDFVRDAVQETAIPAFALGGIDATTITRVTAAGCGRVAVGAALTKADEPGPVAAHLRRALEAVPLRRPE